MKKCRAFLTFRVLMAALPLMLTISLAVITAGMDPDPAAAECYIVPPHAPDSSYGLQGDLLYVANGAASDVLVVDAGTMQVVDTIPVPVQPDGFFGSTIDVHWEVLGVVPSLDRSHIYVVGVFSGDNYLLDINAETKVVSREIALPPSIVGYSGLEYNLNNEASGELIATSVNVSDDFVFALSGIPISRTAAEQAGGLVSVNLASGLASPLISGQYPGGPIDSATAGIAWDASGSRAFGSMLLQSAINTYDWNTRTATGAITTSWPVYQYGQLASDKARGLLYAASQSGYVDVIDMNTDQLVSLIDMKALMCWDANTGMLSVVGVDLAPDNNDVLFLTVQHYPDDNSGSELVTLDVSDVQNPVLIGDMRGLDRVAGGIYATQPSGSSVCTLPSLNVTLGPVYWGSYADYEQRLLSVGYSLGGVSPGFRIDLEGASSTNGVSISNIHHFPMMLTASSSGDNLAATLKYVVPPGVGFFRTTLYASAENACGKAFYPGPYPLH